MYYATPKRYNQMTYRKCGNSGISLPLISLGLWHNFGKNIRPFDGFDFIHTYNSMVSF